MTLRSACRDILPPCRRCPTRSACARYSIENVDGASYPVEEMPTARALRGETTHGAVMVLSPSGPYHTGCVASAAPINTPDGRFIGAVATYSDITPLHDSAGTATPPPPGIARSADAVGRHLRVCLGHRRRSQRTTALTTPITTSLQCDSTRCEAHDGDDRGSDGNGPRRRGATPVKM